MAAAVDEEKPVPPPPPAPSEPRGLEWYLKARGVTPAAAAAAPAPAPRAVRRRQNLNCLGLSRLPRSLRRLRRHTTQVVRHRQSRDQTGHVAHNEKHAQKKEAELFAYMDGQGADSEGAASSAVAPEASGDFRPRPCRLCDCGCAASSMASEDARRSGPTDTRRSEAG